ncbi:Acetyl-coenzyme A transporter 1 [Babesia sp. Xinjiang]|uniref:Acetyl-coenzyme A transporter 1 n=1 Tax=Babesia sp. Xinjiang TaxID=462227 RepID=UPI000A2233BF|nr:Acetyl-coenzyme A transporter 1 [Babesia sp. Xinjiang]ORM40573.1 Acetyl-coenzyme A transporter 1 [Babesia sp. Xinjiang]
MSVRSGEAFMDLGAATELTVPGAPRKADESATCYTRADIKNIVVLLALYIVQGLPLGLPIALPVIIYDKVTYSQLAYLSFTGFPFCLKLLWAPIVDALYWRRIGKRKSWIIPVQLITTLLLFYGGANYRFDKWAGQNGDAVDLVALTTYCTALYILMATQDIAVDGWALSMLRTEVRIHASTCNTAGQYIGINLAYVCIAILCSKEVPLKLYRARVWLSTFFGGQSLTLSIEDERAFQPLASMSYFINMFGLAMLVMTILICFKHEDTDPPLLEELPGITELGPKDEDLKWRILKKVKRAYALLIEIIAREPTKILGLTLLTFDIIYAAENPAELQLLEKGIPRDVFAAITPFMIPIEILAPPFVTMAMRDSSVADYIYKGLKLRLVAVICYVGMVPVAEAYYYRTTHSSLESVLFYTLFFLLSAFRNICELVVSVAFVAFFAKVSDPSVGATYMTLLNALSNVGQLITRMIGFWLIDLSSRVFRGSTDGLHFEGILCLIAGVILLPRYRTTLEYLESFETSEWYVNKAADV